MGGLRSLLSGWLGGKQPSAPTAEDRGARAQADLLAVLDAMPDACLLADAGGVVVFANGPASALLDPRGASLVGRQVRDLFTTADLIELHDKALAAGGPGALRSASRVSTPAGERAVEALVVRLGDGVATILRDLTAVADAVRLKSDFVANASHELRTPIAAIRAALDTLGAGADERMRGKALATIASHTARLEALVVGLLDLAKVERADLPLTIEPLNPDELARALREEFEERTAARALRLEIEFDEALAGAPADARLLGLCLRNLVDNAVKFAHEGTAVRVEGSAVGGRLRFSVADRGVGIPLSHQARVFERFYQADPARSPSRGAGLGLAIVRHAVRAMGGKVGLESVWKEGTRVWFEVPSPPRPERGAASD